MKARIDVRDRVRVFLGPTAERTLPDEVVDDLKAAFTHENPDFGKRPNVSSHLITWRVDIIDGRQWLSLPRGGMSRVRAMLKVRGFELHVTDSRVTGDRSVQVPAFGMALWDFQVEAVEAMLTKQNCLIRAPTASGKSVAAFAAIARIGLAAIVVVFEGRLYDQWVRRCTDEFGIPSENVGRVKADKSKWTFGPVTIASAKTLACHPEFFAEHGWRFGTVVADEVQGFAADTMFRSVDPMPAKYRIGVSADECVAIGSLVVMADGSEKSIESIRVGEEVLTPLGSKRVRSVIFTGLRETRAFAVGTNTLRCTSNTLFGTACGWVPCGSTCYPFVYAEGDLGLCPRLRLSRRGCDRKPVCGDATLFGLRATKKEPLSNSVAHEMQTEAEGIRRERRVPRLREEVHFTSADERASSSSPRVEPLGQGKNQGDGTEAANYFCCDECSAEVNPFGCDASEGCRSTYAGCQAECSPGDGHETRCENGAAVRWHAGWQWPVRSAFGIGSQGDAARGWVHSSLHCGDGLGTSEPLRTGLWRSETEDLRGDRWKQPLFVSREGERLQEGNETWDSRMDGCPLQGDQQSIEIAIGCFGVARSVVVGDVLAVPTFDLEIEGAHCFFANRILVHNTRKDHKECLVYDLFGSVACEISQARVVASGNVLDTTIRVIPTDFRADWYRKASCSRNNVAKREAWNKLLTAITEDEARNALAVSLVTAEAAKGLQSMVLCARIEHCRMLDGALARSGVLSGLMLGGDKMRKDFDRTRLALLDGSIGAGVGTLQAIGQAIDIPLVSRGFLCFPLAANRQKFNQFRGRICRTAKAQGKVDAELFYLWDRWVYGLDHLRNLVKWYGDRVLVKQGDGWVNGRAYMKTFKHEAAHSIVEDLFE